MKPTSFPRQLSAVIAVSVAIALVLAGCSPTSNTASSTLTWGLASAPQSLDNTKAISAVSYTVQAAALETLVHVQDNGKVVPWLATSWSSPNSKTYVFKIRKDVTFWNGDKLTAADVAFSLNRLRQPSSLISYVFAAMKDATVTGTDEVTVSLNAIDPLFLSVAIGTNGFIVQKAFADKAGNAFGGPQALTEGTGPYRVKTFSKTSNTVLTAYRGYWGKRPAASTLTFETITDPETMRIALTQGQVDGTFDAQLSDSSRYKSAGKVTTTLVPGVAVEYLSLDTRQAPFSDIHVRRAIAMAINKDNLVKAQLQGNGTPSNAMMTAPQLTAVFGKDGSDLFKAAPIIKFDVAAAKAELAKSSEPNGFSTTVEFAEYDNTVFQVLQQQLAAIGIKLTGKSVAAEQFYADSAKLTSPQGMEPIFSGYGSLDPAEMLQSALGDSNTAGYSSDVTKAGLATLSTTLAAGARRAAIESISADLAQNVPFVPLYNQDQMLVLNNAWKYASFAPRGSDWIHRISAK